jgi:hypothetical protein
LAKPLYKATRGGEQELIIGEEKKAFKEIKRTLTNTPALGLPDVMKPFLLYIHERLGTAIGVLTKLVGSWYCPVAYLSKQLDAVS